MQPRWSPTIRPVPFVPYQQRNEKEPVSAHSVHFLYELWDSGVLDQKKLDELREQHLRTPYRS
jgi:hypothetical protein